MQAVNERADRLNRLLAVPRVAKGLSSVRNDRARFKKWIAPLIGAAPIATIPRAQLEGVVQNLDHAVARGDLRWKTATNVWGVITKMMQDACRSKVLALAFVKTTRLVMFKALIVVSSEPAPMCSPVNSLR
jgi:hypothetical protein